MNAYPVVLLTVAQAATRGVLGGPLRKIRIVNAGDASVTPVPGRPTPVVELPLSDRGLIEGEPWYVYESASTEREAGPATPVIQV